MEAEVLLVPSTPLEKKSFLRIPKASSHLSKGPSDLKQKGTQERKELSVTVCQALSRGAV